MKVTLLAGGVGGAKFAKGLCAALYSIGAAEPQIIVNTGDDIWLSGLRVCPDLDSMMYALAGVNDAQRGWGRAGESERVSAELTAFGAGWPFFTLGDLDLGTHIARTGFLREGRSLSQVTRQLCARWNIPAILIPATDDEAETWVDVDEEPGTMHFEEWWVRTRATVPARRFVQRNVANAVPGDDVIRAIASADIIIFAPSNPVVSIGTMVGFPGGRGREGVPGIPGIAEAVRTTSAAVVGISPVIAGAPVHGMARACLEALGRECTAAAIGEAYGARSRGGLLDGWLIDETDADETSRLTEAGLKNHAVPLWMNDETLSMRLAMDALELAWPGISSAGSGTHAPSAGTAS